MKCRSLTHSFSRNLTCTEILNTSSMSCSPKTSSRRLKMAFQDMFVSALYSKMTDYIVEFCQRHTGFTLILFLSLRPTSHKKRIFRNIRLQNYSIIIKAVTWLHLNSYRLFGSPMCIIIRSSCYAYC